MLFLKLRSSSDEAVDKDLGKWPSKLFELAEKCFKCLKRLKTSGRTPENKLLEMSR